jgi:hypothetical protein
VDRFQTQQSSPRLADSQTDLPSTAVTPSIDGAMARLAQIRVEIEGHATAVWILEREADELRYQVRAHNAKAEAA